MNQHLEFRDVGEAELLPITSYEWTEVLRESQHDTYHLQEYVTLEAERADGEPLAFCYAEHEQKLLIPLILRAVPASTRFDAISPYGYAGPICTSGASDAGFWHRATCSLRLALEARRVVAAFVRLHPLLNAPLDVLRRFGTVVHHGETVSVDLSLPYLDSWAATRKSHRYEITRARRDGVTVSWNDWARLPEWIDIYYENMRRVNASSNYFFGATYFAALRDKLSSNSNLVLALSGSEIAAGQVVFEEAGVVETHLSAMGARHRGLHPDKLLYDEVSQWARTRGNAVHHLGGGYGGERDGLFDYKAGFSDRRHPFYTWRIVIDNPAYKSLSGLAGTDPTDRTGFFPAYRHARAVGS